MDFTDDKPIVGVSSCLLGDEVRYDGGHKRSAFIADQLGEFFQFVKTCPEAAIGMGVPRPPIHLVGEVLRPSALGVSDQSMDVTDSLERYSEQRSQELSHLSGYILKKDSPSCGMERVKIYREANQQPVRKGQGIFARALMTTYPLLPVEDEGRLNDPGLRENFVNRVYIYRNWRQVIEKELTPSALIDFHARHKYLLMAHSNEAYKRMGRLLSYLRGSSLSSIAEQYAQELMTACAAGGLLGLEEWFARMSDVIEQGFAGLRIHRLSVPPMKPAQTGAAIASAVCELLSEL